MFYFFMFLFFLLTLLLGEESFLWRNDNSSSNNITALNCIFKSCHSLHSPTGLHSVSHGVEWAAHRAVWIHRALCLLLCSAQCCTTICFLKRGQDTNESWIPVWFWFLMCSYFMFGLVTVSCQCGNSSAVNLSALPAFSHLVLGEIPAECFLRRQRRWNRRENHVRETRMWVEIESRRSRDSRVWSR